MVQLVALFNAGKHAEVESRACSLAERYPDSGIVWKLLGAARHSQGKNSLAALQKAAELLPADAEAHSNLGAALEAQGRLIDGVASYRRALEIKPDFAEAHSNLGAALEAQGQLDDAVASYRRALEIKPDFAEAHYNLGIALQALGRLDDAVASYRRALEIKPDYAEAHSNLGACLQQIGRPDEAVASYLRAGALQPDNLEHAINARLTLPVIPASVEAIKAWRERHRTGIAELMGVPGKLHGLILNPGVFWLAYHNVENRPVLEALCRLLRARAPDLQFAAPHIKDWRLPATDGRRIRIGFLSEYFASHTIGKLYRGFIQHLDRARFEVVLLHATRSMRDSFRDDVLNPLADCVVVLPANLQSKLQAVAAKKLDVLFYPDIGMTMSTYLMAYARLAPVQAMSWGHPETTGLDSVDYFVSAEHIEPPDAEAHYTETLVRLNRLPCFYPPPPLVEQTATRAALGLPESGTLYGCPQTLFKIHPDFDPILQAIALGDPEGKIVFVESRYPARTGLLRERWARNCPALLEKAVFLPTMPHERFMLMMRNMDVLLDPIYFGSGNTLYEAMALGVPVVTWPGQFMRGRIVAGAYAQMDVAGAPIASRLEDYAPLALSLGGDPERRRHMRRALQDAAGRELFADMRAVREFEAFVEAAVMAAGRGEKLPAGWRWCRAESGLPNRRPGQFDFASLIHSAENEFERDPLPRTMGPSLSMSALI